MFTNAGEGCGNCRAVETVEKRTACFSTVPTAPTAISILGNAEKLGQQQRYLDLAGHYDQQSVKTIQSQTTVSMAGFEVIMYGRF